MFKDGQLLNRNTNSYASIFSQRAKPYHQAMLEFPAARAEEFKAALAWAEIQIGQVVLDIPSGGGYLASYLNTESVQLIAVDPSEHFSSFSQNSDASLSIVCALNQLCLNQGCIDVGISIAGLHHESNRLQIFKELARVIKPDGKLIIAEVESESNVGFFLNEFVDRCSPSGHQGLFVDDHFMHEIAESGWIVQRKEITTSRWNFSDRESLTRFFRLMFDLQLADDEAIVAGVDRYLGIIYQQNGLSVEWPLKHLLLNHPATQPAI